MKKTLGIMILAAAAFSAAAFGDRHAPSAPAPVTPTTIPVSADRFLGGSRVDLPSDATTTGDVIAGTVNHHALAADLLARFFATLRAARPDATRVIILSPDHYKRGVETISVIGDDYLTERRLVRIDRDAFQALIRNGIARADRSLTEGEHGIGALIPFLAKAYPDAQILPIVIRGDIPRDDAADLGRTLAPLVDAHTVVVISSDMSHYLGEDAAREYDEITRRALDARDAAMMRAANDDFTDNGPSFVALFALFDALKIAPRFELIDHSISSRYVDDRSNTTSYINGVWIR